MRLPGLQLECLWEAAFPLGHARVCSADRPGLGGGAASPAALPGSGAHLGFGHVCTMLSCSQLSP